MPGAVYCPVHRERFHESGVSFREIDYRIIPATYALIHSPEPEHERGDIYRDRYIKLAEDIAFLLDNGFSAPDRDWLTDTHLKLAGESIDAHLLYVLSRSPWRKNRFEDYLAAKLIKDSGKEKIEETVSRQISWLISIEKHFGSIRKFCSG